MALSSDTVMLKYLIQFAISFGLAFIPANIAARKGRSAVGYWFFGFFAFIPALIVTSTVADLSRREDMSRYNGINQRPLYGDGIEPNPYRNPYQNPGQNVYQQQGTYSNQNIYQNPNQSMYRQPMPSAKNVGTWTCKICGNVNVDAIEYCVCGFAKFQNDKMENQ